MSKDAFWFQHDSNAHNDKKVVKLHRMTGSWEAYGVFWAIVEMLRESSGYKLCMDCKDDICFEMRIDMSVIDALFEVGLLESDGETFHAPALCERMRPWDERKKRLREAGRKGGMATKKTTENKPIQELQGSAMSVFESSKGVEKNISSGPKIIKKKKEVNPKARELCEHLLDSIRQIKPDVKQPNIESWAQDMDKILRIDKRKQIQVYNVIKALPHNDFWSVNVLSPKALRKNFDRIEIDVLKKKKTGTTKYHQNLEILDNFGSEDHNGF